jgi:hypothetical protein
VTRGTEIANALDRIEVRIGEAATRAGRIRDSITLVVVTKTYPVSDVEILRALGVADFGENRDSEGREKSAAVPGIWHFQGQIQSNKIRSIAQWAQVIHSIDDGGHLRKLEKSLSESKVISIFLQVTLDSHIGRGGVLPAELAPLAELALSCPHVKLEGIMAVAPLGEDPESAFSRLAQIHSDFQCNFPSARALSAGMSGDFETAIVHGATHVRIGSSILGVRSLQR